MTLGSHQARAWPAALLVLTIALLLLGCGSSDVPQGTTAPGPTGGPDAGSPDAGGPLEYERGPADLVLRVEYSGGFLPVEAVFTTVPAFSLYGDGRLIYSGPVIEIFPGPALPNLLQVQLSEQAVRQVLEEARQAGLTQDEPDLGEPPVADAATTVFTLAVNGRTHVVRAYALGFEGDFSEPGAGESAPGDSSPGESLSADQATPPAFALTEQQREARRRLLDFQNSLGDLPIRLGPEAGPETAYEIEAMDLLVQEVDPQAEDPSGIEPTVREWPLQDLATAGEPYPQGGRRFRLVGEELRQVLPLFRESNTLTRWQSGGQTYLLYLRPLLPDEAAE